MFEDLYRTFDGQMFEQMDVYSKYLPYIYYMAWYCVSSSSQHTINLDLLKFVFS